MPGALAVSGCSSAVDAAPLSPPTVQRSIRASRVGEAADRAKSHEIAERRPIGAESASKCRTHGEAGPRAAKAQEARRCPFSTRGQAGSKGERFQPRVTGVRRRRLRFVASTPPTVVHEMHPIYIGPLYGTT